MNQPKLLSIVLGVLIALPLPSHAVCSALKGIESSPAAGLVALGYYPLYGVGYLGGAIACLPVGAVGALRGKDGLEPTKACGKAWGSALGALGGGLLILPAIPLLLIAPGAMLSSATDTSFAEF